MTRLFASDVCYHLGRAAGWLTERVSTAFLPLYQRLMEWSFSLDRDRTQWESDE